MKTTLKETNHTSQMNQIIQKLLQCGYADVEFICNELENFKVDFGDIWEVLEDVDKPTANNVIGGLYRIALMNLGVNPFCESISIFTNCLDSHLTINNIEMYCLDDVKRAVLTKNGNLKKQFTE